MHVHVTICINKKEYQL